MVKHIGGSHDNVAEVIKFAMLVNMTISMAPDNGAQYSIAKRW